MGASSTFRRSVSASGMLVAIPMSSTVGADEVPDMTTATHIAAINAPLTMTARRVCGEGERGKEVRSVCELKIGMAASYGNNLNISVWPLFDIRHKLSVRGVNCSDRHIDCDLP